MEIRADKGIVCLMETESSGTNFFCLEVGVVGTPFLSIGFQDFKGNFASWEHHTMPSKDGNIPLDHSHICLFSPETSAVKKNRL